LSRWLLQRGWTVGRNPRGDRQGAATLGNWLPTLLSEEAEGLRLKHYQQFPEGLAEQLPRLERIQAWLRLARQVLELPELDRLYGELGKLQALFAPANDPDALAARVAQAHTVATLKPWKLLLK
jgi:inorganic triphosphatase YgiF